MAAIATAGGGSAKRPKTRSQRSNPKYGGLGAGSKVGKSRTPYRPPVDKKPAPARSNKGGATRGRDRARQVGGKAKAVRAAIKGPSRVAKAPTPVSTQQAAMVGINAYRDYANSMTNLARTGIRGPGFQMPNLNPFDYIGQGLDALGNAITGGVRNTPNPGANIMSQGERIRDVLNRR